MTPTVVCPATVWLRPRAAARGRREGCLSFARSKTRARSAEGGKRALEDRVGKDQSGRQSRRAIGTTK